VLDEIVELRRRGFRFIALADDNFYPVTLNDLRMASRRENPSHLEQLKATRAERFELMAGLERLPADTVFFTQITMEAAEDPEFLDAMRRANIKGALVGVESVTPEGLKDVYKDFNASGEALVERLRAFREHGVHVLGSFIFGLPSDRPATFDACLSVAERSDLTFAQFVMLTPFPGTLDFTAWEKSMGSHPPRIGGMPVTRHWLIPQDIRPKVYVEHPVMSADEIRRRTQLVWDRFYSLRSIWNRVARGAVAQGAVGLSPDFQDLSPDVREHRHRHRQRARQPLRPAGTVDGRAVPAPVCRPFDAESTASLTRSPRRTWPLRAQESGNVSYGEPDHTRGLGLSCVCAHENKLRSRHARSEELSGRYVDGIECPKRMCRHERLGGDQNVGSDLDQCPVRTVRCDMLEYVWQPRRIKRAFSHTSPQRTSQLYRQHCGCDAVVPS
jgi:hypothetical protein